MRCLVYVLGINIIDAHKYLQAKSNCECPTSGKDHNTVVGDMKVYWFMIENMH